MNIINYTWYSIQFSYSSIYTWYSIHSYPSIYTWYSKHSSDPSIYTWYSIQSSYSSNYTWYSKHSSDPSFSSCKTSTDGSILTPDLCVIKNMVCLKSNLEIKTYPIAPGLPTTKRGIQENTRREDWEKNKSSTLLLSMGTLSKLRYRGFINIPPSPSPLVKIIQNRDLIYLISSKQDWILELL